MRSDAKRGGHSVGEASRASVRIELCQSPLHAYFCHDGVAGFDPDRTVWHYVELQVVLNANEAILTTESLSENCGCANALVPSSVSFLLFVSVDCDGSGDGVRNLDLGASLVGLELEPHLLRWGAAQLKRVVQVSGEEARETRHARLTSVETVPHMVHHAVQSIIEACCIIQDVDGLDTAVHGV